MTSLLETLVAAPDCTAMVVGDAALSYPQLRDAAGAVAQDVAGSRHVAVWAQPRLETAIAVTGTLAAGAAVVPVNPKAGSGELSHQLGDAAPELLLAASDADLPELPVAVRRVSVDERSRSELRADVDPESVAIVLYTSGTTGPPKGVLLPHRALESNLAALAAAWQWTAEDRLVHGLPLSHIHGLVLGTLGPLRLGGTVEHLGRFSPAGVAGALLRGGTMLFGVPTMYHRLAGAAEDDRAIADALGEARLLVSGSAALPATLHERIERICGQRVVERYGMSEAMMIAAVRADGDRRPGYVGRPLPGVDVRLVADDGTLVTARDDATIGEVAVRGPNVFLGYLNRDEDTRAVMRDGWFMTGDLAVRAPDGYVRLVGRRSTDLIKSGGYRIGAGEVENALLEHPAVAEVAVTGEPDEDLGERIVAWVVLSNGREAGPDELSAFVAKALTPHKRPRTVRFVASLPRNEMGKVRKRDLNAGAAS